MSNVIAKGISSTLKSAEKESARENIGANYEYGSNANGEYIKFPDGTMICTKISQSVLSAADGTLASFTETFAEAFIDTGWNLQATQATEHGDARASAASIGVSTGTSKTTTSISLAGFSPLATAGVTYTFYLTATGRWF